LFVTFQPQDDNDSNQCCICFEPWNSESDHNAASLRCGHIFGRKCVEHWLKTSHPFCPLCKTKSRVSDIRAHYISYSKPNTDDKKLEKQLKETEDELTRTKRELEILKSSLISMNQPKSPIEEKSLGEPYHDKGIRRQQQQQQQRPVYFGLALQSHPLVSGNNVDFCPSLNACIISCSLSSMQGFRHTTVMNPTLHGKSAETKEGLPFASFGIAILQEWWKDHPMVTFIPLHEQNITSTSVALHDDKFILTTSLDGSVKVIRLTSTSQNMANHPSENGWVKADIVVQVQVEPTTNTPVSFGIWSVNCWSLVYVSVSTYVYGIDLHTGLSTALMDISPSNGRQVRKDEKIFALISLPLGIDSPYPRLLVGATWGIFQLVLDRSPKWDMSQPIITLGSTGQWTSLISEPHGDASQIDSNPPPHWNVLKRIEGSHGSKSGTEEKEENSEQDNDPLFICGYMTSTNQKFMTFDLRLNARNDVPAPMRPIILSIENFSSHIHNNHHNDSNESATASTCFFKQDDSYFILAQNSYCPTTTFTKALKLLRSPNESEPIQSTSTPLLSHGNLRLLSKIINWKMISDNGMTVLIGISPTEIRFITNMVQPED
jgi:hypothetical protein